MHDTTAATATLLLLLAWGGVGAVFFWEWFLRDALRRFRRQSRASQALIALGIAALVVIGGIKSGNPPLRTPTPGIPPPSLSTNQCLAGFALVVADTNAAFLLDAPTNAVIHTNWLLRGASRDAFAIESTAERPWSFRLGTNRLRRVWVSARGTVSFAGPFDSATGPLPDASAPDHLAPFHAALGIVPEANWQPPFSPCVFWHDTTEAGSLRLTWRNALFDRDANTPVSFQTELFPSGDFAYRYDFGDTAPTNAVIGAQNNGGGESWANAASAQRVELRWRHFSGIEPGVVDTDGDGLSDYDEVFVHGTDPARADSDADGIADGGDSAPNNADADGDGIPDGANPAAWSAHPFLANNAGFTNLVLAVVRGMDSPLRSGNASGSSALLDVGGLKIPLRTGDTIPLGLPGGVEIAAALRVRGNLPVRLQLSPGPDTAPFRLIDPEGVFSHGTSADATARLSFPLLSLVPLTDTGTGCLHEGDTGAEFQAVLLPLGWDDALAVAEIEGFYLQTDGTLWLNGPEPPFATNTGTVAIRPPWLRWGTLSASASVHWCVSGGSYCHACGTVHTAANSCTHDADCAARFSDEAECDCVALFVRVNSDDDDLDGTEDRFGSGIVPGEDDLLTYHAVGVGDCCCESFGEARVRITGVSSGFHLWTEGGDALATGGTVSNTTFLVEATAPSPAIGMGYVGYDILDEDGQTVRSITRRFTMANVQILPDWNDDGDIDENDILDREMDGIATWHVIRRSEAHLVRFQNECPSDAVLTLSLAGASECPVLVAASEVYAPSLLFQGCSTNLPPFAAKNGAVSLLVDASGAEGAATLAYSISDTNGNVIVSAALPVQSVEASPGTRCARRNSGDVEWDYSNAPAGAYLSLLDPDSGDILADDDGDIPAISSARPAGTYPVEVFLPYLWEDGIWFSERTGTLEIVDIRLATNRADTVAGSLVRIPFPLADDASAVADWRIEPVLPDGARLFTADLGGTGVAALSGVSNVWVSAGAIPTNYVVRAAHAVLSSEVDTATLHVGRVRMIPDYDFSGSIDTADFADAETNRAFRIWLNNDNDDGMADGWFPWSYGDEGSGAYEVPEFGVLYADYSDGIVNGNRDRLDWFPLWLDIGDALAAFPTNLGYRYELRQTDSAIAAIPTSLTRQKAGVFQTHDDLCAGTGLSSSVTNAAVLRPAGGSIPLPGDFLDLAATSGAGIVLVEGRSVSSAPLVLRILDSEDQLAYALSLPLSVSSVEDMFRFVNLRPATGGSASPETRTNAPPNRPYVPNGKNVFLVHGFRVGANESRGWGSEFFKKLLRSGSRADFWMVTWNGDPSDGIDYYWAVNNAFLTASNLVAVVNSIPGEKVVMAHSLGNMVVSSAFADHGMDAGKYFALNAAVAGEAFDDSLFDSTTNNPLVHSEWYDYHPRTWSACWNELFPTTDDRRKLTWKGRFASVAPKVYNYWSSGDEVIEIGGPSLSLLSNVYIEDFRLQARQFTWHKQELFKGRNILYGSGWCGWGFESNVVATVANAATTNVLQTTPIFEEGPSWMYTNSIPATLRNKVLAYGIPALSAPVGRMELSRRFVRENHDMNELKPEDGRWCRNHMTYEDRWLHSDIQNAGYFYTHKVFDSFAEKGALK